MKHVLLILFTLLSTISTAQIIDVHMHSYTDADYWGGNPQPTSGAPSPKNADDHLKEVVALMNKHHIQFAVVSGSIESIAKYSKADSRFIPGYQDDKTLIPPDQFEKLILEKKIRVFGEVSGVYFGRTLADPLYDPYLKLCEQYDIPVAYHTGGGPPMTPYRCCPEFRLALGDPLLIENVLVKYPKLRLYLMHGGEFYYEHTLRMMLMYRQLYIDLGVLLWIDTYTKEYAVQLLHRAKDMGLLNRVMFGSDQMVWPEGISRSIEFLNSLDFLNAEEKEMILYTNAKRFLKL